MAETNTGEPDKSGPDPELRSLEDILDALSNVGDEGEDSEVSVEEVLTEVGTRSFAPIILVPSLILISPISGIFGLPTIGAIFILLITVQKLLGRPHVWMPGMIRRRKVTREKLGKAIDWLRRPCAWVDRQTHKRLTVLVSRPARLVTLLVICAICLIIPALEILPMVTSLFATAISFFAIALLARDGLFTLLGYIWLGCAGGAIWWLVSSGVGGW
ncbi:exopolysaccharide biosynthesis protein [Pseudooceanicola sp. HF7]|nr:exopolysaccharide biosynthesis protein [Pseudooceanicola sp. HF7]